MWARIRAEDTCGTAEGEKINADPVTGKLKEAKPKAKVGGVDGLEEENAAMLGRLLCPPKATEEVTSQRNQVRDVVQATDQGFKLFRAGQRIVDEGLDVPAPRDALVGG
jgi:hypothetical protein